MSEQWNNDAPPQAGWYVASSERNPETHRHWNGTCWSAPVDAAAPYEAHRLARARQATQQDGIKWRPLLPPQLERDREDVACAVLHLEMETEPWAALRARAAALQRRLLDAIRSGDCALQALTDELRAVTDVMRTRLSAQSH